MYDWSKTKNTCIFCRKFVKIVERIFTVRRKIVDSRICEIIVWWEVRKIHLGVWEDDSSAGNWPVAAPGEMVSTGCVSDVDIAVGESDFDLELWYACAARTVGNDVWGFSVGCFEKLMVSTTFCIHGFQGGIVRRLGSRVVRVAHGSQRGVTFYVREIWKIVETHGWMTCTRNRTCNRLQAHVRKTWRSEQNEVL